MILLWHGKKSNDELRNYLVMHIRNLTYDINCQLDAKMAKFFMPTKYIFFLPFLLAQKL